MNFSRITWIALGAFVPLSAARADLLADLIAYYDFEATGTDGLANRTGGGATHNGSYGNGATFGVTPAIGGSGAGFAGDAAYPGVDPTNTTDRSVLLVGNALNISKDGASTTAGSGWFNVSTLNAATLGSNFAISAWFYLAPDEDNTGTTADILRDYVFESADVGNFDVSFGTDSANGTTFVSWIGGTSGAQNAGTLATGEWHHVVHVFSESGANTTLGVYINGSKVGPTVSTATANMNFTSLNFGAARIGSRVFDGMLDEVAVWSRSLTASEVTELHERGRESLAIDADLASVGKAFVSVDPSDPAMGQTFGRGLYDLNEQTVIEALPALGHVFTGWSAPFSGQPEFFFQTVTESLNIVANFARDTADDDGDGLTNYEELIVYFTDPGDPDTDGDLINDRAEVQETQTNPLVSQLAAVTYILENLGPGGPGAGDTVLTRNEADNTLSLLLKPAASTTLAGWAPLTPATPGISAGVDGGLFQVQVPASGESKRFFRVEGDQP